MSSLKTDSLTQNLSEQLFTPMQKFQKRWFMSKLFKSHPRKMPEISVGNEGQEQFYAASYITNKSISLWFIHKDKKKASAKIVFCNLSAKATKEDVENAVTKALEDLPLSSTLLTQMNGATNKVRNVKIKQMQATIKQKIDVICYLPA